MPAARSRSSVSTCWSRLRPSWGSRPRSSCRLDFRPPSGGTLRRSCHTLGGRFRATPCANAVPNGSETAKSGTNRVQMCARQPHENQRVAGRRRLTPVDPGLPRPPITDYELGGRRFEPSGRAIEKASRPTTSRLLAFLFVRGCVGPYFGSPLENAMCV